MSGQTNLFAVRDLRRVGYFTVDNEIIDDHATHIGAYGVAVYNVISRHARNESQVKLSARDIGATLGISHDRVRKSLADLVTRGLIHHEIPTRPGPGLISTILLLNVKTTGRHTSSSAVELDATRPRNKEVKQKLETETSPLPLLLEGFALELPRAREARETSNDFHAAPPRKEYDPEVGLAIDWRKLTNAKKVIEMKLANGWGADLSSDEIFKHQCVLAEQSLKRAREVEKWAMESPETQALGASA